MRGTGGADDARMSRRAGEGIATLAARLQSVVTGARVRVKNVARGQTRGGGSPFTLLRRRLVVTNLVVAAVVLAVLSVGMYAYEDYTAVSQLDSILSQVANHGGGFSVGPGGGGPAGGSPPGGNYTPNRPDVFVVVVSADHEVVEDDARVEGYGLPDWSSAVPVLTGRTLEQYVTVQRGDYSFRLYTRPIIVDDVIVGAVQTGSSLAQVDRQLRDLVRVLALLGAGVLALTAISSAYLTERALAPARGAYARQRQFTAGASHELRTPLAYIRSQAELIAGASTVGRADAEQVAISGPEDEVTSDAREIITEVDYMSRLVTDLLVLARDEHDQAQLSVTTVDLTALAEEAAAKVRPMAEARGLGLFANSTGEVGTTERVLVRGDADRLRQLCLILLDNAVRYTPSGGSVRVDVKAVRRPHLSWEHAGQAYLIVSDTGVGIAAEHQRHIFEPFYRAVASRGQRSADGGTGLGLALAQWIAQAHRGSIAVKSERGNGSTFTVTLPLMAERPGGSERP